MTSDGSDVYTILGVDSKTPFEEVKKAYRRKALEVHPDKNPDNVKAATENFQKLQAAFASFCRAEEKKGQRSQQEEERERRQKKAEENRKRQQEKERAKKEQAKRRENT